MKAREQAIQEWIKLKNRVTFNKLALLGDIKDWEEKFNKIRDELDKGWDSFIDFEHPLVRCKGCKSYSVELYDPRSNNWVWGCQEITGGYARLKSRIREIYKYHRYQRN